MIQVLMYCLLIFAVVIFVLDLVVAIRNKRRKKGDNKDV